MKDRDNRVDELLELLGQEISESRYEKMKQGDEGEEGREYVDTRKRRSRRMLKVCSIVLCVIIGTVAVTTATSEAFRVGVFGFFFEDKGGHADMVPTDEMEPLYPSYMTEGYEFESEDSLGDSLLIHYKNEKGQYTSIIEEFGTDFQMSFDTETLRRERCRVGSYEGYFFHDTAAKEGDQANTLIWEQDGMVIYIDSAESKEEMIKIAKSLE